MCVGCDGVLYVRGGRGGSVNRLYVCFELHMHFGEYIPSWPPAVSVAACCSVLQCVAVCCR